MVRDTSLSAYQEIKIELGKRQQLVYDMIKKLGCPTNLEISKFSKVPINQITPRTNELVKLGFVVECEKRECSVSGRTVWSWRIKNE
tara:strand:+ start:267 stop:527 length:261 start_codon:yes stop_codon:yes gene_type:complete